MPFNGSGTFSRLYSWVVDAANSVNISSSRTDAEMNGFAAGLTNCITRDGQSPPSADLPMGGKKLVNLGLATTATDALSQAAGDARYILLSATSLSLSGSITAGTSLNGATLAISGNGTIGGTLGITGAVTASNGIYANGHITVSGSVAAGFSHSQTGQVGYHLYNQGAIAEWLVYQPAHSSGDDSIHIGKVQSGVTTDYFIISPTGLVTISGSLNVGGAIVTVNTNLLIQFDGTNGFFRTQSGALNLGAGGNNYLSISATGAISQIGTGTVTFSGQTNLGNVTGTPNGTAANGLGYMGAPSTVKTANYALATTDIGQDITFNGTTLTCTIPAGLPNGYVAIIANINASALTITSASDTLTLSGTTTTGNRTLGQNGEARIIRRNGVLYITGTALS